MNTLFSAFVRRAESFAAPLRRLLRPALALMPVITLCLHAPLSHGDTIVLGGAGEDASYDASVLKGHNQGTTYLIEGGNVTITGDARGVNSNIQIVGGHVTTAAQFALVALANETLRFDLDGGELTLTCGYGFRGFGGNAYSSAANGTLIGTQTGGTLDASTLPATYGFQMGSTTSGNTVTYTLQDGLFKTSKLYIQASTAGDSTTAFILNGGKLLASEGIQGAGSVGSKASFVWTGGILATSGINMEYLTTTQGVAATDVTAAFVNGGGILAPGDIGTAGRTTISGGVFAGGVFTKTAIFDTTAANAVTSIDIGGTTKATAFQAASGAYDNVYVNKGYFLLGGKLNLNLINGFDPASVALNTTYTIFEAEMATTDTSLRFANDAAASDGANTYRVALANGVDSFKILYNYNNNKEVRLTEYRTGNEWRGASGAAWGAANAGSWKDFTPSLAGHIAVFANGGAAASGDVAVDLDASQTVRGLKFDSADRNYNISGGNTITFEKGDAAGAASAITVAQGHHSIAAGLLPKNDLALDIAAGSSLTLAAGASLTLGFSQDRADALLFPALALSGGGELVIADNVTLNIDFSLGGTSGVDFSDAVWQADHAWDILTVVGGSTLTLENAADIFATLNIGTDENGQDYQALNPDATFTLAQTASGLQLRYSVVPEPATWAMMAGGLGVLALLRRRKGLRA